METTIRTQCIAVGQTGATMTKDIMKATARSRRRPRGFTLVELLVVISIIALLISLLLPALAQARIMALRTQCASNLHQIGVAMQEYAVEFGMYPPGDTETYPMGAFDNAGYTPPNGSPSTGTPTWGLSLLFYDSFSTLHDGLQMTNIRPGILQPTMTGISLIFSPQPGVASISGWIPARSWTSNGMLQNWNFICGYCYWVDRGTGGLNQRGSIYSFGAPQKGQVAGYSPSYDWYSYEGYPGGYITDEYFKTETNHMPAENQNSNPGSILCSDVAVINQPASPSGQPPYQGAETLYGLGKPVYTAVSNHVDTPGSNLLPDGIHDLYNDGSVIWNPMSEAKLHYRYGAGGLNYYIW